MGDTKACSNIDRNMQKRGSVSGCRREGLVLEQPP